MFTAFAVVALSSPAEAADVRTAIDQAKLFIRKGWHNEAAQELELALAEPEARNNAEAWFLLAQVRYQLCDLVAARAAAERAHANGVGDAQLQQTRDFAAFLRSQFGLVHLEGGKPGTQFVVHLQLQSTLFDPDLKRYVARLKQLVDRRPVTMPHTLGLPVASYTINGAFVHIDPSSEQYFDPFSEGASEPAAGPELEIALGLGSWFGQDLPPAPAADVSIGFSSGPVVGGPVVSLMPQSFRDRAENLYVSPVGVSAGGRIGLEMAGTQPWVFRTSVVGRVGLVPGLELGCRDLGPSLSCAPGATTRPIDLYVTAMAAIASMEVAILHRDRSRPGQVGFGVKLLGDLAGGVLPGASTITADGNQVTFDLERRSFGAPGLRAAAAISLGL